MNRALVIKTYGDPETAGAIKDGMMRAMSDSDMNMVIAENKRLNALNGVRSYGDSVRWETIANGLAVKYSTPTHGRLYEAVLGLWGLLWEILSHYWWWVD